MNNLERFAFIPSSVDIPRSRVKMPNSEKTTFNFGKLVPVYVNEILPGTTVDMDMSALVRLSTPVFPTMDRAFVDILAFFCPNRLLWDHWEEFCGENKDSAWVSDVTYSIPQIYAQHKEGDTFTPGWRSGGLGDHMGLPIDITMLVSALPFRAYRLIWNEWFRDENVCDPLLVNTGDGTEMNHTYDELLNVARFHDYFSSCLPSPQKGPSVSLPLGTSAPVTTFNESVGLGYNPDQPPLRFGYNVVDYANMGVNSNLFLRKSGPGTGSLSADGSSYQTPTSFSGVFPVNLVADLSAASAATINQLRQAFAVQRFYEALARGGSRYRELLQAIFGVTSPDARMQIPEYLGGKRIELNMSQVVQTSATGEGATPQGNVSGLSKTLDTGGKFTKSFVEHGYLIVVACARTQRSYQQGIHKMWTRKNFFDFYVPQLANIGEQPVYTKELYYQASDQDDNSVFGYQEAWAEYRYKPNTVSGAFRSGLADGSLDSWHYADYYASRPYLSEGWLSENANNVDRTLAVTSALSDQLLCDFYFDATYTLPMPLYSVPGMRMYF